MLARERPVRVAAGFGERATRRPEPDGEDDEESPPPVFKTYRDMAQEIDRRKKSLTESI